LHLGVHQLGYGRAGYLVEEEPALIGMASARYVEPVPNVEDGIAQSLEEVDGGCLIDRVAVEQVVSLGGEG
jgi:hypothetical protein